MKYLFLIIFISSGFFLLGQKADKIIYNGNIYTVNRQKPFVEAIAIKGDKIIEAGNLESILNLRTDKTKMIDADGSFVMPGFIEGHGHYKSLGESALTLDLKKTNSWQDVIDSVANRVASAPIGEWITGRGWHQEKWISTPDNNVKGFPVHAELSAISPNNPVLLRHASGHLLFANKKAMELAGIDRNSISPSGGEILRDSQGDAIGIFNEAAADLIGQVYYREIEQNPIAKWKYWEKCIDKAAEVCLQNGITSFQDAGSSFEAIDKYREKSFASNLKTRLWVMLHDSPGYIAQELDKHVDGPSNDFFHFGGIKAYIDGALGSYGALLLEPYSDQPDSHGHQIISNEDLSMLAENCKKYHLQLCTHAIGDKGNRIVLDIYEQYLDESDRRWRVEHAQHLHPDDIHRFSDIGVIAAMQPVHCTSDAPFVIKRLGKERARTGAYVWRSLMSQGTLLNLGTDTPVESVDPFMNLYAATTRIVTSSGDSFFPDQKLSIEEAIWHYTLGNAYSVFQEGQKGSLEAGKFADIIFLSENLLQCDPDTILKTKVLLAMIGGEILYRP